MAIHESEVGSPAHSLAPTSHTISADGSVRSPLPPQTLIGFDLFAQVMPFKDMDYAGICIVRVCRIVTRGFHLYLIVKLWT